jgi:hypothetical protein
MFGPVLKQGCASSLHICSLPLSLPRSDKLWILGRETLPPLLRALFALRGAAVLGFVVAEELTKAFPHFALGAVLHQ